QSGNFEGKSQALKGGSQTCTQSSEGSRQAGSQGRTGEEEADENYRYEKGGKKSAVTRIGSGMLRAFYSSQLWRARQDSCCCSLQKITQPLVDSGIAIGAVRL